MQRAIVGCAGAADDIVHLCTAVVSRHPAFDDTCASMHGGRLSASCRRRHLCIHARRDAVAEKRSDQRSGPEKASRRDAVPTVLRLIFRAKKKGPEGPF